MTCPLPRFFFSTACMLVTAAAGVFAQTPSPALADTMVIKGALTYKQRIALPPDASAVVELRDASMPEGPVVAEKRFVLNGAQVPVPFELSVSRAKLTAGKPYAVRGALFSGAKPIWVSEPKTIDLSAGTVDVGTLLLTQAKQRGVITEWRCGAQVVSTGFYADMMDLVIGNESHALRQIVSGSGARFEGIGEPKTISWTKGDTMMLTVKGLEYPGCLRKGAAPLAWRARGNEPFWSLARADDKLTLSTDLGQTRTEFEAPKAVPVDGGFSYTVAGDRKLVATLLDRMCSDTMTGMPHPYTATVVVDGKTLNGCAGDPATLLQGAHWQVQSVGGLPVIKSTRPSMFFDAQGRVTGNSSCNRFFGGYSLSGEGLKIEPPAGTMMACKPEVMKQEGAFLKALASLNRFEFKDGALVLLAADGTAIVARR